MSRTVVALLLALAVPALAERPRDGLIPQDIAHGELGPTGLVPYNTLYLNRCASGCLVTQAAKSNSINNTWPIPVSSGTLSAFPFGDAAWQQVVDCVKDTFSPYNIRITDVNPGSVNHFEIMIAGLSTELGMSPDYGGVAPGGCTTSYMDNALVFDFAKVWSRGATTCDAACIEDICSTAAQEIGHVWKSMDHVIIAADPMTYYPYDGRRYFNNIAAQCGSDCTSGRAPNTGEVCDGPDGQNHSCRCTHLETQNSYDVITSLFGAGTNVTPPTATFLTPKPGASVQPGFAIGVDATDDSGKISRIDVTLDGQAVGTGAMKPWNFTAPASLGVGAHQLQATAYDIYGTPGNASVDVFVGGPCEDSSDCTRPEDVCVADHCVGGPSVAGGLGTTCSIATDCFSNMCAFDGSMGYCVESCMPGQCPDGFGCLDTGGGQMVCWPGADEGGCGCSSSGRGGPAALLLVLGVMALTWRRKR